jgi:hypothetical protein
VGQLHVVVSAHCAFASHVCTALPKHRVAARVHDPASLASDMPPVPPLASLLASEPCASTTFVVEEHAATKHTAMPHPTCTIICRKAPSTRTTNGPMGESWTASRRLRIPNQWIGIDFSSVLVAQYRSGVRIVDSFRLELTVSGAKAS